MCVCVFLYRRNFYACVNLRVYAALPLPTITAPQPAWRKKERGSFKTQIRLLHNQQFCSSPKPPCSTNAHSLSSSPPLLSPSHAGWQSPPNVLLSSLSNSSSLFSSLVPRPTHCLCSSYLLYELPLWSLSTTSSSSSSNSPFSFLLYHLSSVLLGSYEHRILSGAPTRNFFVLLALLGENLAFYSPNVFFLFFFLFNSSLRENVFSCFRGRDSYRDLVSTCSCYCLAY